MVKPLINEMRKADSTDESYDTRQPQHKNGATDSLPFYNLRSTPQIVAKNDAQHVFDLTTRQMDWGEVNGAPRTYIENQYEDLDTVVFDHATGLLWQKSGSEQLTYEAAQKYIITINEQCFAGYSDWRLPTVPELISLLEPGTQSNGLYINPVFDSTQLWCWSADTLSGHGSVGAAWYAYFNYGLIHLNYDRYYVRVVRSATECYNYRSLA